jgi:5-amino-6-(D-ribitylamino)uracil---L-tyrosine 4-hydroxyphenyl transferase
LISSAIQFQAADDAAFLCSDHQDELSRLWSQPLKLFRMANLLRERTCGDEVSFVINRNINFTNRCIGSCKFCAFHRRDGYMLTLEQILDRVAEAEEREATEICLQGGLVPEMALEDYCQILETIRSGFPRMHLHAYSPMEVLHMSRNSGMEIENCLWELKRSGLGSMPGTAAEILVDSVRQKICPEKLNSRDWMKITCKAHLIGIPTTSTMLYGHVERFEDRLRHLQILREIQAKTHGFTEFVMLPFMPGNNALGTTVRRLDLLEHLKMHAMARIMLHPLIRNVQASWTKLGREAAAAALNWGVNDLGGTLMEENISRSAGSTEVQYLSAEELIELIEAQGKKAVQRTTLYERLDRSRC